MLVECSVWVTFGVLRVGGERQGSHSAYSCVVSRIFLSQLFENFKSSYPFFRLSEWGKGGWDNSGGGQIVFFA